ncbi:phosphoribosylglycinamide formyltransferase [Candidatus Aminicenantes bacterium AC-708-M15]|jgi:phosphoribosylglycinamide formyltransferase-1|nr:phosphoribosylglycinamide formyltransferase [SCandidatus Aminicenantes bacterium Aminicenantia_JdfR_composite]MCP2598466.1 phosphoribosylglycinamide formyltransferase [Candidatus Aminicenantes bacterium AC-335-L06]MCP2604129.1 phosphoribosylglycinamide formyltransferase [Candidatus Aminicenantes bacterium AC-708-M15]MCP2606274.1 phosphoribosylglycinamide formyltransferase [Candidatus Aminicenantes bacterium AC-708-I09]MCP2617964.1 phosphoribosylglycinamide formyltransferase [Candidatus Amini
MENKVFTSPKKKGRIAVLLSGRGSNFMAIHDAILAGKINAEIVLVFSNKKDARGLQIAKERGLETLFLDPKDFPSREEYDKRIVEELKKRDVDLVCLAGYMRILTPYFVNQYRNRIMNIHPALLPSFPGLHAQKQALDYGVKFSGATVHFVTEEVDAGPIIIQAVVPVFQYDTEETLSARILEQEHKIYPEAIKLFFEGKLEVRGRKVYIRE